MVKRIIALGALLILSFASLGGCGSDKKTQPFIDDLNENFNGEYKIGQIMDGYDLFDFEYQPGFGGFGLLSADERTHYSVGGYPDTLDDQSIIYFYTEDEKYRLWDFGVGSELQAAIDFLQEKGYDLVEDGDYGSATELTKHRLKIILGGTDVITHIRIRLESTNRQGIVY